MCIKKTFSVADIQCADSIILYDAPDASGIQEQKGALQVTDEENTVNAPITDGTRTSAGNAIPEFVVPTNHNDRCNVIIEYLFTFLCKAS